MLATFGLLFAAFATLYAPPIPVGAGRELRLWQLLFSAAVACGAFVGLLDWRAAVALCLLWLIAAAPDHLAWWARKPVWKLVAVLVGVALALHLIPGFEPWVVARDTRLTPDSASMTLRANFDKGAAGLLLLAHLSQRPANSEWPAVVRTGFVYGIATSAVAIGLVVAHGAVQFDPKWTSLALYWMPINLFLTCVFEEVLFRGVIQKSVADVLRGRPAWKWAPLTVASVLFGLAHAGGGGLLILAASLAGVGYGLAYTRTGRLESAVLAHFVLNATHFFAFTYPYAAR